MTEDTVRAEQFELVAPDGTVRARLACGADGEPVLALLDKHGTPSPSWMFTTRSPKGAIAEDVAEAHRADLKTQEKYGVRYIND